MNYANQLHSLRRTRAEVLTMYFIYNLNGWKSSVYSDCLASLVYSEQRDNTKKKKRQSCWVKILVETRNPQGLFVESTIQTVCSEVSPFYDDLRQHAAAFFSYYSCAIFHSVNFDKIFIYFRIIYQNSISPFNRPSGFQMVILVCSEVSPFYDDLRQHAAAFFSYYYSCTIIHNEDFFLKYFFLLICSICDLGIWTIFNWT